MSDIAIIIQGTSTNIKQVKDAWKNFSNNVFFSTWNQYKNSYTESDNTIFSDYPTDPGPGNLFYQAKTTLAGLYKAKEKGFNYALKIRSDILPTNDLSLVNLLDFSKFNFLCWHKHVVHSDFPGYLVDYLMSGPIDGLIKLWEIKNIISNVAEITLTDNFYKNFKEKDIVFFLEQLAPDNDLYWIKYQKYLSSYKVSPTYNKYKVTPYGAIE